MSRVFEKLFPLSQIEGREKILPRLQDGYIPVDVNFHDIKLTNIPTPFKTYEGETTFKEVEDIRHFFQTNSELPNDILAFTLYPDTLLFSPAPPSPSILWDNAHYTFIALDFSNLGIFSEASVGGLGNILKLAPNILRLDNFKFANIFEKSSLSEHEHRIHHSAASEKIDIPSNFFSPVPFPVSHFFHHAPFAINDTYSVAEDQILTVPRKGVLTNDQEGHDHNPRKEEGDADLKALLVQGPSHGTLSLNADGSFVYTPNVNYNGPDSFTYKANDGSLNSNVATVNLIVTPVNDAPVAVADSYTLAEDAALVIPAAGLLLNDGDLEGDPLSAGLVQGPAHGTLSLNADGSFVYTPNANYNGPDSFTYKASDGTSPSNVATVNLTVTPVNDVPVAASDSYTLAEDATLVIPTAGLLVNDGDVEGDPLSAVLVQGPAHGTLSLNADGSFVYTPNANYNGPDSFTYKANDGSLNSNVATVNLTVTPVNDAPVAVADSYTLAEDAALVIPAAGLLLNDGDGEGDPLSAVLIQGPSHGTLSLNADGSFVYTPNVNYNGPDSFTYKANDGSLNSNVATVNLIVTPVNDAPVAVADSYTLAEDAALVIPAAGLLLNDGDVEGDPLSAVLVQGPAHGTLLLNADGSFVYTPNANYNGPDSFTYKANDGSLNSNVATVNLTVTPVNDAPVAVADSYTLAEDAALVIPAAGLLVNDGDVEGDPLSAVLVQGPAHGTLSLNADGSFVYTPNANYHGPDSFTYKASDGTSASNMATVNLTITPVNDAPVAVADSYTLVEDAALVIPAAGLLVNDGDVESDPLNAVLVQGPAHGTLSLNADGSFVYTPNANYNGPDSFTYKANDRSLNSNVATVNLTVTPVNDAPVAVADSYTLAEDAALVIPAAGLLLNDGEVESDPLSAVLVQAPAHGTLSLNADGSFVYTPNANYNGPDSFTYKANDGSLNSNVATVNLTVTPVNDAPVAVADSYTLAEDAALVIPAAGLLVNDGDVESNPLNAVLVQGPAHGTLSLNADGSFVYTPNANYNGPDSFTYKANDGLLNSNIATVNLTITPVNDAPVAVADSYTLAEDATLVIPAAGLLLNDGDVEGDPLSAVLIQGPAHGTLSLNADGSFVYTPNANYHGPDSFTYKANDGSLNSNVATVNLTVTPVNDAPVAVADSYTLTEDAALVIPASGLLLNDGDVEGDPFSAVLVQGPAHGTLSLNADGSFVYTPNANYNGPDSFTYRANDGSLNSNVATVNLTVTPLNTPPIAHDDPYQQELIVNGTFESSSIFKPGSTFNEGWQYGEGGAETNFSPAVYGVNGTNHGNRITELDAYGLSTVSQVIQGAPTQGVLTLTYDIAMREGVSNPSEGVAVYFGGVLIDTITNSSGLTNTWQTRTVTITEGSGDGSNLLTFQGLGNSDSYGTLIDNISVKSHEGVYVTTEDTTLTVTPAFGILGNDHDPDGDPLSAILVQGPAHGTLLLNADGSFVYTPNANYHGPDSFTYKANDGSLNSNVATVNLTVTPVNDAPVAVADSYTLTEDAALVIPASGLLLNDGDVEGDPFSAVLVQGPAHGTLSLNADGSFVYTPNANYNGPDSFTYRANDGSLNSNVATVNLTVTPVNDAPVAVADSYTLAEDEALVIPAAGLLVNDGDVEGDPLSAVLIQGPAHGTLLLNADGSFVYTPNANYNGPDSFTYKASDGSSASNMATVNLTVTPVNDAPVAVADSYTLAEDAALVIPAAGLLVNDGDVEGDPLSAVLVQGPAHGTLSLNADGSFVYTPNANYHGPDSFTYKAKDVSLNSNVATVNLTVTPVNDAPVAVADSYTLAEDAALVIPAAGLLVNDSDLEGDPLSAVLVQGPAHGTLSLNADGSFVYTPNPNYNGPDSFTYKASDGSSASNMATVNLTVTPVNDAPVAVADSYTLAEDAALVIPAAGLLLNDGDVEGDPLSAILVQGPAHGTLSLNADGSFVYTPNANYNGPDSFTYKANDGSLNSNVATVNLTVTPVNDAPVAVADSYTLAEDAALVIPAAGLLVNDGDVEGDPLSAVLVQGPAHGTLSLSADGSLVYTPNANYNGPDSFTYKANDGSLNSNVATVNLTVTPVNDAPVGVADSYTLAEDAALVIPAAGLLLNDGDVEGDPLSAVLIQGPAHGTLSLNADGSFVYTPDVNYNGPDSFTYKANDGSLNSNVATVNLTVTPVNDAPVAVADSYTLAEDATLVIPAAGLLLNDGDVEGDPLSAILVQGPAHGTLSLNADGSFVYTPHANYNGPDSFTYKANDGSLNSNVATVNLTVTPVNDAPVAVADSYTLAEDATLVIPTAGLLVNDGDVEGDPLSAVLIQGPAHGTLSLNADGSFVYTPNANYHGSDSFTYKANDGSLNSNVANVNLTVTPVNDAPVAVSDSYTLAEDATLVIPTAGLLVNDGDVESNPLNAVLVQGPAHGTLSLNADGSFVYTPNPNYNGPDSFTYKASDGSLNSNVATVNLTVTPVNDAPVAVADSYTLAEDEALVIPAAGLLVNDGDVEGDPLSAILVQGPAHGTLSLNADGSFVYTPHANYNGPDSFTYKANDGSLNSNVATVNLTVTPVNDAPVAVADSYTLAEDAALVIPAAGLLVNDGDVEGDSLSAVLVQGPAHGTLSLNADGSFVYTPNANYQGPDSFTYKASDGTSASNVATVNLTVTPVNDAPVLEIKGSMQGEVNYQVVPYPVVPFPNLGDLGSSAVLAGYNVANISLGQTQHAVVTFISEGAGYQNTLGWYCIQADGSISNVGIVWNNTSAQGSGGNLVTGDQVELPTMTAGQKIGFFLIGNGFASNNWSEINLSEGHLEFRDSTGETSTINSLTPSLWYVPATGDAIQIKSSEGGLGGIYHSQAYGANVGLNGDNLQHAVGSMVDSSGILRIGFEDLKGGGDRDYDDLLFEVAIGPRVHQSLISEGQFQISIDDVDSAMMKSATLALGNGMQGGDYIVLTGVSLEAGSGAEWMKISGTNIEVKGNGSTILEFRGTDTAAHYQALLSSFELRSSSSIIESGTRQISLTVTDDTGLMSNTVEGSIIISDQDYQNSIPLSYHEAYTVGEEGILTVAAGQGVLANDTDPEGDPLSAVLVQGPAHGTLSLNADGSFVYTPDANYHGPDSFTYRANDGSLTSNTATVNLTVTPVNDAPVAVADSYTLAEDATLVIPTAGLLLNDGDVEGDPLSAVLVQGPAHGTLSLNADGSFVYTPHANYNGPDSFTYKANDGSLNSNVATVNLTVTPVNDAPVAVADSYTLAEDATLVMPAAGLLVNDGDVEGGPLSAVLVQGPAHGTLSLNADGSFVYTPNANYHGPDSFTYKANDGSLNSNIATVNLTVTPVNDAPVAVADSYTLAEDAALVIPAAGLLVNDGEVEGDPLSAVLVQGPAHGTLSLSANGSFVYTPNPNYNGPDSFTYKASDGTSASNVATVNLTVTPVNDAPVAVADSYTLAEDATLVIPAAGLLANDSDVDGNSLTSVLVQGPSHGTLTLMPDGSFVYTPNANYNGPDSFTYKANDGSLKSDIGTVNLTVTPVNDAPVIDVHGSMNVELEKESLPYTVVPFPNFSNSTTLASNYGVADIKVGDMNNVRVSLVSKSGSYENTLGWYKIAADGKISDVGIIWENTHGKGSGGNIKVGDSINLPTLSAGQEIGFFLVADGGSVNKWNNINLEKGHLEFRNSDGSLATVSSSNPSLWYISNAGAAIQIKSALGTTGGIYHTEAYGPHLALDSQGLQHAAGSMIKEDGTLRIGFEDGKYSRDFNELVIDVKLGQQTFLNLHTEGRIYVDISDVDSATMQSATLHLSTGARVGDYLALSDLTLVTGSDTDWFKIQGTNIEVKGNGSATLEFKGVDTISHYEKVLSSFELKTTSLFPESGMREISLSVVDDKGLKSNIDIQPIHIGHKDDTSLEPICFDKDVDYKLDLSYFRDEGGNEVIKIGDSNINLDLKSFNGHIENVDKLTITGENVCLALNLEEVADITDSGKTLHIDGSKSTQINLDSGWQNQGPIVENGITYNHLLNAGVHVYVDSVIQVVQG